MENGDGGGSRTPISQLSVATGYKPAVLPLNYTSAETKNKSDYAAYSLAEKDITVNGKTYKTVAVIIRGTPGSYDEWKSNFNIGYDTYF